MSWSGSLVLEFTRTKGTTYIDAESDLRPLEGDLGVVINESAANKKWMKKKSRGQGFGNWVFEYFTEGEKTVQTLFRITMGR